MSVLEPAALAFAALLIPLVLLYVLRLRRREQTVSSTLLWRMGVLDREANALWQRLRPNILLLLQALTLLFLVFALTRPYTLAPAALTGRVVVLLDTSLSMAATDAAGGGTRFEQARREVFSLIDQRGAGDEMTIIAVDASPRAVVALTRDRATLRAAVEALSPTPTAANWSVALSLASALATANSHLVLVSDGANPGDLRALATPARFIAVGGGDGNLAIASLALRPTVRGFSALTRVINPGSVEATALLSLRAFSEAGPGALLDAREVRVPAGGSAQWTVNGIDPAVGVVRATIDGVTPASANSLAADDSALALASPATPRRALLLTRGNRFLEQALAVLPNVQTTRALSVPVDGPAFDLIIVDAMPATLPPRSRALILAPVADTAAFTVGGTFSSTKFVSAAQHPTLTDVDWRAVNALDARALAPALWLRPLVEGQGGPLLLAGEPPPGDAGEQAFERLAVLAFDVRRSDFPLQIAFPVWMANTVGWLAPPRAFDLPESLRPGEVAALPVGTVVKDPAGATHRVDARGFAETTLPGLYGYRSGETVGQFVVNVRDPAEADLRPDSTLATTLPAESAQTAAGNPLAQREIWPWLAALALVALMVEWWIYQRGLGGPRRERP